MKMKMKVLTALTILSLGFGVGATVTLSDDTLQASAAETIVMKENVNGMCFEAGAAVRTDLNSMGIRFTAYFDAEIYEKVETEEYTAGMIVVPAKAIENISADYFGYFESHGKTASDVSTTFSLSQFTVDDRDEDETVEYSAKAAIVNIKDANLAYEYQAVAWYKPSDGDYVYSGKSDVRTISDVTNRALNASNLTETERNSVLSMATVLSNRLESLDKSAESDFVLATEAENGINLANYQSSKKTVVSAMLDGVAVTISNGKIALTDANVKSSAQSLKLTYTDESTLIINVTVSKHVTVNVANTQKHELYASLNGDTRVANAAMSFSAGTVLPTGLTWEANGVDVTEKVIVSGETITFDAVGAGLCGGEYSLVGSCEINGMTTTVKANLLLVNKIITTANDLLAWEKYLDVTKTGTVSGSSYNRTEGYLELGANIDLGANSLTYTITIPQNAAMKEYGFNGTFDGCGYTLLNGQYGLGGLFGLVGTDGVIKNVAFTDTLVILDTANVVAKVFYGELTNVIVDASTYGSNVTYQQSVAQFLLGARLTNVIAYSSSQKGSYASANMAIAQYAPSVGYGTTGETVFTNVWVFTLVTDGDGFGIGSFLSSLNATRNNVKVNTNTTAPNIVTGMPDMFNLSLDKAYFANYAKTLANFDEEIESIPTELNEGESITLPTLPYVKYSVDDSAVATISNNVLTISNDLEEDATVTLTINLSAYGVANKTVDVFVKNRNFVVVEDLQEYEVYPTLDSNGSKVENSTPFTIELDASVPEEGMTWTTTDGRGNSKDVTAFISVSKGVATISSELRGEYKIVGKNADESVNVEMNVLIVNKFIMEASHLQNIKAYGDISDEKTLGTLPMYKFDGYFAMKQNVELGESEIGVTYNNTITDYATNKQDEYGFIGTFDGRGYTFIGGVFGNKENADSLKGIFGSIGAAGVVKNVAFVGAVIGYNDMLMGSVIYGTLDNVLVEASYAQYLGAGLAENILGATISNTVYYVTNGTENYYQFLASYIQWTANGTVSSKNAEFKNMYFVSDIENGAWNGNQSKYIGYKGICNSYPSTTSIVDTIHKSAYTGTSCATLGLENVSGFNSYWNFNGARARFNSYTTIA